MGFLSVLLLNNAFEMKCNRFDICKHGLVGTWGLLIGTWEGITSFIQLFKEVFDFKKCFTDAGGGAIRSKFVRLYANRSGGTFGLNPSKKIFNPNVRFLQGRRDFVSPFPDCIILMLSDLIPTVMNSGFIIVEDGLPKFKGSSINLGLIPQPEIRLDTQGGVLTIGGIREVFTPSLPILLHSCRVKGSGKLRKNLIPTRNGMIRIFVRRALFPRGEVLITHITPSVKDTMSMLKGIQGLNRLTVLSHGRGDDYGINTRSSIFPFESNKIKGGPNSERAPVIITKIIYCVTFFSILIEIPQNDNILVGMTDGIIRKVLKKRCRVFNRSIN